ncbi:MAG TPA: HAMP domain-containing sensor histidine kinase [Chitinophagales bacterium]|nr:HAMP domain-containing sensor histidine kinase [Chitinophagales bacterium]
MKPRAMIFFYILTAYVFASFIWWSYLLLKKNSDAFSDEIMLGKIKYDHYHNLPDTSRAFFNSREFHEMKSHYERQKWMIASEGMVFLFLLSLGSVKLWQTFRKEIELARQQNNFLLSITHELKSPLASMKLSLQTLLKRAELEDKFKKLAENSVEDVDRLGCLVDNILYAARMEDASFKLHKEVENISEITSDLVQQIQTVYKDSAAIRTDIQNDIFLETERMAYASALQNLVENAIKYSHGKAEVEVSLHQNNSWIVLEVKDSGIGIPENERSNIFKKFYRIGNEETRHTKGTGLGLFIVKKVVDLHNGKITVQENEPSGTVVRVELPVNK